MTERLEKIDASSFKRVKTIEEVVHIRELRQERQNLLLQLEEMQKAQEHLLEAIAVRKDKLEEVKNQIQQVVKLGVEDKADEQ